MTTQLFISCFLIGLLGIAFQTLIKIKLLKDKAKVGNIVFNVTDYFKEDWITVALNLVTLAACILAIDEILKLKPSLLSYIKWFFFFVGFTGSTILNSLVSNVNKRIMKTIDEKTNIADGIIDRPEGNTLKAS